MKSHSGANNNISGGLWFDSRFLNEDQNASSRVHKVADLFELLRDTIYCSLWRLICKRPETEYLTQR